MSPDGPDELSPSLGAPGQAGEGFAPELGSRSPRERPWWRSLRGPIAVLLADLGSKTPAERRRAAEALARLGDRRAIPAIAASLHDSQWEVRRACVEALVRLGGDEVLPALHRALRDGHAVVRLTAAEGLSCLGTRASIGPLTDLQAYLSGFAPKDAERVGHWLTGLRERLGDAPLDS